MKTLAALMAMLIALAVPVAAQNDSRSNAAIESLVEAELGAEAGITPDSVFYAADIALEKTWIVAAVTSNANAKLHIRLAEERLAEMEAMADMNKTNEAREARQSYEEHVGSATESSSEADGETKVQVDQRLQVHTAVLESLEAKFQSQGMAGAVGIGNAIEASQNARASINTTADVSAKVSVGIGGYEKTNASAKSESNATAKSENTY